MKRQAKTPWVIFGKNKNMKRPFLMCEYCRETHTIVIPVDGFDSDVIGVHLRHFTALHLFCTERSFVHCMRCQNGVTRTEYDTMHAGPDGMIHCVSCDGYLTRNLNE